MSSQQTSLTGDEAPTGVRVKEQRERALDVDGSPYGPSEPDTPEDSGGVDTACRNPECENVVTQSFVRVFGSNDGAIYRCLECTTFRALQDGDGSHPHEVTQR